MYAISETRRLAGQISRALPNVKSGTLRFWGEWFGRPYDNRHTLVRCEASQDDLLKLYFHEDEVLSVWSPRGLTISSSSFRIAEAHRVRWEWFYYGRPKIASNLYFEEFVKSPEGILVTSNIDWYKPDFRPTPSMAAVEIL